MPHWDAIGLPVVGVSYCYLQQTDGGDHVVVTHPGSGLIVGCKSDFFENRVLDFILARPGASIPSYGHVYMALLGVGLPSPTNRAEENESLDLLAFEVVGGNYQRQEVRFFGPRVPTIGGRGTAFVNLADIAFPTSGDWGGVSGWAITPTGTSGDVWYYGRFPNVLVGEQGLSVTVAAGTLEIIED